MPKALRSKAFVPVLAALVLMLSGCASTDASLQSLTLGTSDPFTPSFSPTTFNYTVEIGTFGTSATTNLTATPTSSQATMRLKVGAEAWVNLPSGTASSNFTLPVGDTDLLVEVTSGNGENVRTYTITVTVDHIELPHF